MVLEDFLRAESKESIEIRDVSIVESRKGLERRGFGDQLLVW